MKSENGKVHLTLTELKALVAHTGKGDPSRPVMANVHFVLSEGRAYATCGHRIAAARFLSAPEPGAKTLSIRTDDLRRLTKFPGASRFAIWPDADGKKATAAVFGPLFELGSYRLQLDDLDTLPANFPTYAEAPTVTAPRAALFCIDLNFVADLKLVLAAAVEESSGIDGHFIAPAGPLDALVYVAGAWLVAIMPKRSDACMKAGEQLYAWKRAAGGGAVTEKELSRLAELDASDGGTP